MFSVEIVFNADRRRFIHLVAAVSGTLAVSPSAFAAGDDAGIYDADIPKDWSFVRIAASDPAAVATATIGEKPFKVSASGISDYVARAPGDYTLLVKGQSMALPVGQGQYLTILSGAGGKEPVVVADAFTADPAKCALALYNLTDAPVSLTALAKRSPVIKAVSPMSGISLEVNAVAIDLNVEIAGAIAKTFEKTTLKRRSVTSIFVLGSGPNDIVLTSVAAKA
ncbi:alginate O-acetyltransferase AlgF [Agrobacterium sp. NPDC090273]|uniref:alginate O-acetyltransferase AlgF n=1 Tax=Agrobacterium sp. NPDC090273 TaxID=3363919 RepID=UPI003839E6E2